MMSTLLVSVFIRVRDEARALEQVLHSLRTQLLDFEFEIVVLDNQSTDDSALVATSAGASVYTLPRALFSYGRAINLGCEVCQGEIIVLLSAHSIPQSRTWLSELVSPLLQNTHVGAAYCLQIPARPITRLELRRFDCFQASDTLLSSEEFLHLCREGKDPYECAVFSNSACAIRRSIALRYPFRDLLYAEDRAFVVDYLCGGGMVAYSHNPCVSYERAATWKSMYRIGYRAQVSKRLIRELSATYTGHRFNCTRESLIRLSCALLVLPALVVRVIMSIRERRGLRWRAVVFALRSTGTMLGMAKGVLLWQYHRETLACDSQQMQLAKAEYRQLEI